MGQQKLGGGGVCLVRAGFRSQCAHCVLYACTCTLHQHVSAYMCVMCVCVRASLSVSHALSFSLSISLISLSRSLSPLSSSVGLNGFVRSSRHQGPPMCYGLWKDSCLSLCLSLSLVRVRDKGVSPPARLPLPLSLHIYTILHMACWTKPRLVG